nr:RNA-binding protein 39 isoform X2 [Tanacetum cinerariifolium]
MEFDEYDYLEKTVDTDNLIPEDDRKTKKPKPDEETRRHRDRSDRDGDRERERERTRRSRSHSRIERERERDKELIREKERDLEARESRRLKDKKEAEPEADPERDQRTVFAYQMPLKATEFDVYEFFSKAGKVRDVRLIMDRNSRRSKGVGYIEFYDAMSVPMAIAMSGHLLLGQPVMVKPSEAEKNLVQSTASTGGTGGIAGPYGAVDRKLYVGNLHFNMTELQLKQIFEAFGPVELVQLPTDPETGHCKGFGFIQFAQLEHSKAALSLNGKLEIAGRIIKVSSVTDHVGAQDTGAKAADFDDDEGGGLALNAQSRAMLMAKLDRSGIASSVTGPLGVGAPLLNGSGSVQAGGLPFNGLSAVPVPGLAQMVSPVVAEPIGIPSECLLLKNMFDPATEVEPDFDLDIKDDVEDECSNFGKVKHIHVDKQSAGYVYLRFDSVEAASRAQQAMHKRWFAGKMISAIFLQPYEYDAKFKDAKRLIGRRASDEIVQVDMKLWPFKVVAGSEDKPKVVVTYKGERKEFTSEEISSMVLSKMKGVAETYLGSTVKKAVITVPAYFNDSQRQSTKDAATVAGLEVIRMINEPTAAAIAYTLDKRACWRIDQDTQAAHLTGMGDESEQDIKLIDFTPLSLGVEEDSYTTGRDGQTAVSFLVNQGERSKSKENFFVGKLRLSGIPSAPRGQVEIIVCYEIDANGILNISAREITTGRNKSIKITNNDSLSKMEIEKMIEDSERYKLVDEAHTNKTISNHEHLHDLRHFLFAGLTPSVGPSTQLVPKNTHHEYTFRPISYRTTSAVRNTAGQGKEISQGNLNGPVSDVVLREYCDKHYNQLLLMLAEKMHQKKVQQEKLKAVKTRHRVEGGPQKKARI